MSFYSFTFPSKTLSFPVEISISLPFGNDIPTLWLLHGANCDHREWFDHTSILRYAADRNLALITVSAHNAFYVNMAWGVDFADFLEGEFIGVVRALFPCLSRKREKNYLAGASMGGFGAFRLGLNRMDVFSKLGSFAGSIEMPTIIERNARGIQPGGPDFIWAFGSYEQMINNNNDVVYLARQCLDKSCLPEMYMISGTEDFGYALGTIARDDLIAAGCRVTWVETPGVHSFSCWDSQIPQFLDWLEGKEVRQ